MTKNLTKKGFTLIELLVVIAIIGILSSVVLASLNTARDKGKDASAKGSISSLRAEAELYYDSNGNYGATASNCTSGMFTSTNPNIKGLIDAADAQNGSKAVVCSSTGTSYAVHVVLNDDKKFCVDSSGFAGIKATGATGGICS